MKEELKRFSEAVASDKNLEKELLALADGLSPEDKVTKAIEFANAKGFQISKEDFVEDGQKVDLEEMEKYAGGETCACVIGGGGGGELSCFCPFLGSGWSDTSGVRKCECLIGGGGGIED